MNILTMIPAAYRKFIYTAFATVMGVELALDLVGWGLVPADAQGKVAIVAGALGFTLAASNTNK